MKNIFNQSATPLSLESDRLISIQFQRRYKRYLHTSGVSFVLVERGVSGEKHRFYYQSATPLSLESDRLISIRFQRDINTPLRYRLCCWEGSEWLERSIRSMIQRIGGKFSLSSSIFEYIFVVEYILKNIWFFEKYQHFPKMYFYNNIFPNYFFGHKK